MRRDPRHPSRQDNRPSGVDSPPDASDVAAAVSVLLGDEAESVTRFPIGFCHYVFDVRARSHGNVVVRLTTRDNVAQFMGAIHWNRVLRRIGLPLPRILSCDVRGDRVRFPCIVMERVPGSDLASVYAALRPEERQTIAMALYEMQLRVRRLGLGTGYGYSCGEASPPHRSWENFLRAYVQECADRIRAAAVVETARITNVLDAIGRHRSYWDSVSPVPFLDDIAVKNVIVHQGQLSGIVDVDELCYGDADFLLGFINMAVQQAGWNHDYIDAWCSRPAMNAERATAIRIYTAMLCVAGLSTIGHRFNRPSPEQMPDDALKRTVLTLGEVLNDI